MAEQWPHRGVVAAISEQRSAWETQLIEACAEAYRSGDGLLQEGLGRRTAARIIAAKFDLYDKLLEHLGDAA